jgi:hypothetical protein
MAKMPLTIDASVAGFASLSTDPRATACREFLESVRRICFRLALSDAMEIEWLNHAARKYARLWRSSMEKKKKLVALGTPSAERLLRRIRALDPREASPRAKEAMEKDAMLIVAARHAAGVLISADDIARRLFEKHAVRLGIQVNQPEGKGLRWLNPITDTEEVESLLRGPYNRWPYK